MQKIIRIGTRISTDLFESVKKQINDKSISVSIYIRHLIENDVKFTKNPIEILQQYLSNRRLYSLYHNGDISKDDVTYLMRLLEDFESDLDQHEQYK